MRCLICEFLAGFFFIFLFFEGEGGGVVCSWGCWALGCVPWGVYVLCCAVLTVDGVVSHVVYGQKPE